MGEAPLAQARRQSGDVLDGPRHQPTCKYELVRTYVGAVAEVEVEPLHRRHPRAESSIVAHDCGQIINPDGLKNQIEGNVDADREPHAHGGAKFDRSMVTSLDWESYPILRFPQVPELVIDLIDRPNEKPWGAGEPAAAVMPSAISNAVFDAIGVRLRSVPFTPDKVKAAMKGSA